MADIKKFLDQQGVSTLWSKIAAELSAEEQARAAAIKEEADRAKLAEADIAGDVADLSAYVGEFTHATAKSVVEYINAKTDGIATSGNLEALAGRVTQAEADIDAIEADYLKAADKTELQDKIDAVSGAVATEKSRAEGVESSLNTRLASVEDDYLKNADKTALENGINGVAGRVSTLEGDDTGKSVRTIANEELAKQLVAEGAAESLDTLAEIAAWIQAHPDDASAMNQAIVALQNKVDTGDKTVSTYVADAISALSIGDYAKAADLATAITRIATLEAIDHDAYVAADTTLKSELEGKIGAKADQTALNAVSAVANAAATKTYVDTELGKKANQADLEAEVTARQNAVSANATEIAKKANKTYVDDELAKKQNVIPANTYDAYGAAASALSNANTYADTEIAKIQALTTAEIDAAIAAAQA